MAVQPDGISGGKHQFLTAATTGDGTAIFLGKKFVNPVIYLRWSTGCSAGAVDVITASDKAYTGTWATLADLQVTFADSPGTADREDCIQLVGVFSALNLTISTNIVGGTVDAWIELD
jgi:hypothetical protein